MKVTTKSSMTTTPMIQIMADQLYRVEKEKEKEKDYLLFHLEERALPLFDNNANHGNGKTRKTLTIDYPSLVMQQIPWTSTTGENVRCFTIFGIII